jgi:beta-lactamase superfamily II metal-dependent hydrolase
MVVTPLRGDSKETHMRMMLITMVLGVFLAGTQGARQALNIYVVDVEGGNATLVVAPSGESLLFDTGNAGAAAVRDADRIMAAAKDAGIRQIDHLVTTHYHADHVGGLPELAARIPIRNFIDHGPNVQPGANIDPILQRYADLYARAKHTVVKPGDRIPLAGVDMRILTAANETIKTALPGAGRPNPYCAGFRPHTLNPVSGQPVGNTEDEQSVGSHMTFGKFRFVYLGDLTWNKEFDLMCPNNRIGTADLFLASRHGQPSSNSQALVYAIQPRVTIVAASLMR